MGFRIVLAAYLGSEGMGLYQLILALYMVFVSFATAGVNVASARLAAQSLARGSGMAETLRGLCITALGFGTAAMLAQSVLAGPCARYLLHDVRAETALLILAPSLPFMAVSGAVRGCFLAARRVQPNITAQLIEQLVRMAVAAAGLRVLAQWGAGYGCAAVLLGNTVSESVSCGIMLAFAARTPEFAPRPGAPLHPYTRKELYDILWPVEGSRLLASALQAAESSLIPYTLAIYTGSRAEAVAQYGSLKGMALPLLFFPFSVLGALSGLLMPEITRAHTKGDTAAMRRLIFTMLRMTGAFSLAAGVGFVLLGAPLAGFIYRDAKVGRYVQLLGFVAPFMYLPYVDAYPDARGGFTDTTKEYALQVVCPDSLLCKVPENKRAALSGVLKNDPRPSYQHDPERVYTLDFGCNKVKFTVDGDILKVVDIL